MKISIVIPTANECRDLESTVACAWASDPHPHEVVVVDDCSDEPASDRLKGFTDRGVSVVRLDRKVGPHQARRAGAEHAIKNGADAMVFLDSHMRPPLEWLVPIQKAIETYPSAMFCCGCTGMTLDTTANHCGAYFDRTLKKGAKKGGGLEKKARLSVEIKWCPVNTSQWLEPVPCLLGASYVIPTAVWESIKGWNQNSLGWGCCEPDICIRAHLLGHPVMRINSLMIPHRFGRRARNVYAPGWLADYNFMLCAATHFEDGVFEDRYQPYMIEAYDAKAVEHFNKNRTAINEFRAYVQEKRQHTDAELADICGYRHPSHEWQKAMIRETKYRQEHRKPLMDNPTLTAAPPIPASKTTTPKPQPKPEPPAKRTNVDYEPLLRKYLEKVKPEKILEWGPGLSTQIMAEMCPNASIDSTEHLQRYFDKAKARLDKYPNVHLKLVEIKDIGPSDYDVWPLRAHNGQYDLIFVDGRRRASCLLHSRKLIHPDGVILLHDCDRLGYQAAIELFDTIENDGRTIALRLRKDGTA